MEKSTTWRKMHVVWFESFLMSMEATSNTSRSRRKIRARQAPGRYVNQLAVEPSLTLTEGGRQERTPVS